MGRIVWTTKNGIPDITWRFEVLSETCCRVVLSIGVLIRLSFGRLYVSFLLDFGVIGEIELGQPGKDERESLRVSVCMLFVCYLQAGLCQDR